MPIAQFHLVAGQQDDAAIAALLAEASLFYAQTLYPGADPVPLERVRAFATLHDPHHWATGGRLAAQGGAPAPWFLCLALAGRARAPLERLMRGFTDLVVRHCGCDRAQVRGQLVPVAPQDWWIGGEPAGQVRAAEVAGRAAPAA